MKLGPTGDYSDGMLNAEDGGDIVIGIRIEAGNVIIGFGTSVDWVGMDPARAREFANRITNAAIRAEQGSKQ